MTDSIQSQGVVFYCSSISWGGLEMNFVRHATWLLESGLDVSIFCVGDSPIAEALTKKGIAFTVVKRNKKYGDLGSARKLGRLLKEKKADILWITDTRDISLIALTKTFFYRRVKVVYRQAMRLGVNKKDLPHTLRFNKIDAWVSLLPYMSKEVKEKTKVPDHRLYTIPLGVELERFTERKNGQDKVRSRFGLRPDSTVLGLIGRIDEHKGQVFVVQALKDYLNEQQGRVELLIVGEPTKNEGQSYFDQLMKGILEAELDGIVHVHPYISDTESFYHVADVVVVASRAETFGMVTIEAMASGCAVVGSDSAGTAELLGRGELGLLFEPENPNELEDQIKRMVTDKDMRLSLGKKAREQALMEYSKSGWLRNTLDMLKNL